MSINKSFSVIEKDYEPIELFSDLTTIEGVATYLKFYSRITGNNKIKIEVDGVKFKPNKEYLYEKDVRKPPASVSSNDHKYYVITRSSKSHNIYVFNDVNFLNGIYIGIGLCREDYKYIIRGIGETLTAHVDTPTSESNYVCDGNVCRRVVSDLHDGLDLTVTPEDKLEVRDEEDKLLLNDTKPVTDQVTHEEVTTNQSQPVTLPSTEDTTSNVPSETVGVTLEPTGKVTKEEGTYTVSQKAYGFDGSSTSPDEDGGIQPLEPVQPAIVKRNLVIRKSPLRRSPVSRRRSSPKDFDKMKLADLKKYAEDNNINIKGLTNKSDIVARLRK